MSATPAVVSTGAGASAFWEMFCAEVKERVREGNAICGDRLWITVTPGAPALALSIQHVERPADRVDCFFDPSDWLLTCTPGPEIAAGECRFEWIPGTVNLLRRSTEEFTVAQAVTLLLDELVWPDM